MTVVPAGATDIPLHDVKRYAMRQPCVQLFKSRAGDGLLVPDSAAMCRVEALVSIDSRVAGLVTVAPRGRLPLCSVGGPSTVDFALVARLNPVPSSNSKCFLAFDNAPTLEKDSPRLTHAELDR